MILMIGTMIGAHFFPPYSVASEIMVSMFLRFVVGPESTIRPNCCGLCNQTIKETETDSLVLNETGPLSEDTNDHQLSAVRTTKESECESSSKDGYCFCRFLHKSLNMCVTAAVSPPLTVVLHNNERQPRVSSEKLVKATIADIQILACL